MIYVPMLKNRKTELNIAKDMNSYIGDDIIPLFEIINELYKTRYEVDENGGYIYEQHKKRRVKVKAEPTDEDIITLEEINDIVEGKLVFVDYFRFSLKKYGKNLDFNKAELSFNLNNNLDLYKAKILEASEYSNMIPVISLKSECGFPKNDFVKFVAKLQKNTIHIALRITEEWIDYIKDIIDKLRKTDFLLLDIGEQNPKSKFMEIQDLIDINEECQLILLNSPRKANLKNGEYPEHAQTDLIDNCARFVAEDNEFDGYGDYCGLKDVMPTSDGSNGMGAALALLYSYEENVFYSYCNHDTSLGMAGYKSLIPIIKADEKKLNAKGDCPGYKKIHSLQKTGSWSTWHYINAIRYIHEIYKNI